MSTIENVAYAEGQDGQESSSVFDFLYHDARRIGSFLSQFDKSGHLQQIRQTESAGQGRSLKRAASGTGEIPMVLKGQVSLERQWNTEGKEAAERVYDPLWANALTFLDYLEDRNLVERQITRVRIGQFVLASGCLSILDLGTLKGMWDLPSVRKLLEAGAQNEQGMDQNRHERRRQHLERRTTDKDSLPPTAQIGLDLITRLPHAIQARLTSDETSIWCSLPENNLTVQSSDLALKHGSIIPGVWHMLGILDALPDGSEAAVKPQSLFEPIVNIMEQLAPLTRQLLGRPPQAYGMTPLLIFRAVTG